MVKKKDFNPFKNEADCIQIGDDLTIENRVDRVSIFGSIDLMDRINPDTLRKMVEEFVTREWSELADSDCTFEDKIEQVIQQLNDNRIKVVFDLTSETCNIVPADRLMR